MSSLIEKWHKQYPDSEIHLLLRKGNESLYKNHPFLKEVLIWDKSQPKLRELSRLLFLIRRKKFDAVINVQRFFASGFLTAFSGAAIKVGFSENPMSWRFTKHPEHGLAKGKFGLHEIERNQKLIAAYTDSVAEMPKLYPGEGDLLKIKSFTSQPYVCIAPGSVWFTKQFPEEKWRSLINSLAKYPYRIFLLGGPQELPLCNSIRQASINDSVEVLAGKLSLLESAALMKNAIMNFVNDSAPLHLASAVNAPVTAIFCSTIPEFGFAPLSENSHIVQVKEKLKCRPCGLHGKNACPEAHFKCAKLISENDILHHLNTSNDSTEL